MKKKSIRSKRPARQMLTPVARLSGDKVAVAVDAFFKHARQTKYHYLEMSRIIHASKQKFTEREFADLCRLIGYPPDGSTIRKFLAIGARYVDWKAIRDSLPDNWTSLYKLTQVTQGVVTKAVKDGTLTSETTARTITTTLLDGALHKPQAMAKPMHSITLAWQVEPDCGQVGELLDALEPMRAKYGNFDIVFSRGMELLLKRSEQSGQEFMSEVHREVKARFRTALRNAKRQVQTGKTFVDYWGCSEQDLKAMPIHEAMSHVGSESDQRVGDVSYDELVAH